MDEYIQIHNHEYESNNCFRCSLKLCHYSIKTTDDIAKALEDALNDACGLENSHARARTIGYLCQISLKALEVGELEKRLEALEDTVFSQKQRR